MGIRKEFGRYLGDAVYGALDGIVTTFAVVAGVAGADLPMRIILIMGFANLLADGVSMAAGNYLSRKSDGEFKEQERVHEIADHLEDPARGREEIRSVYSRKGFTGELLERIVDHITKSPEQWASETMEGEHGLGENRVSPRLAGAITFGAFVIIGFVPLLSYVLALQFTYFATHTFVLACVLTALTIFIVGSLRSYLIKRTWMRAGIEMLLVGGFAAAVAWLIGFALKNIV